MLKHKPNLSEKTLKIRCDASKTPNVHSRHTRDDDYDDDAAEMMMTKRNKITEYVRAQRTELRRKE